MNGTEELKMKKRADIITDLGNGDSGKGTMIDYLVRRHAAHTVIRYSGGAQALHRVVTKEREHVFSLFGAGTLVPGVRTHLSRHVIIHLHRLLEEEKALRNIGIRDGFARQSIDRRALVATPFHQAVNCLREIGRGEGRHGSCGMGIGETRHDHILGHDDCVIAGDLDNPAVLRKKFRALQERKQTELETLLPQLVNVPEARLFIDVLTKAQVVENCVDLCLDLVGRVHVTDEDYEQALFDREGQIVFEGSQGVLLDQWHGFHPYTTWSITTSQHAHELLREYGYDGEVETVGVLRGYATRHGPGPFVTENDFLTRTLPDARNEMNDWQRAFRVGYFDAVASRYAIAVDGQIDTLAITCLDRLVGQHPQIITSYNVPDSGRDMTRFVKGRWGKVCDIRPKERLTDQVTQAKLTEQLLFSVSAERRYFDATREWSPRSNPVAEFTSAIQNELQLPVRYVSFGETAEDKYTIR